MKMKLRDKVNITKDLTILKNKFKKWRLKKWLK
jgi:hypothetical protein